MEKQNRKEGKLSQLPVAAAEFIKLVIKKMRYRKKVREDVQAELAAHFEDELKQCPTDEEREQKAQQLIAEFGDVKLLAVLLRRAKKRCRPLWRTVVARTFQTVGVLIVCFVIYVVWFLTGKPVITTNYVAELNDMIRPVADESLNAAPFYAQAAKMFEDLPDDISQLLRKKINEVTADEKQRMANWLADNEKNLQLVIVGSGKPYYWKNLEGEEMLSILMPHLSEYRRIAFSLRWRVRLRAEQNQYEDAFSDIKTCYRVGQHLKGDRSLIEQLVGVAMEVVASQNLRSILSQYEIDSATLATLQKDFERMVAGEDFTMSFVAEKMCVYDEIQRCFTEDRFGGGHLYLSRVRDLGDVTSDDLQEILVETIFSPAEWPRAAAGAAKILFLHPDKQETREMADRFYAFCETIAQKTPAQIRAEGIDVKEDAMEIIKDNVLLQILAPALERACERGHRNKTDVKATFAIVALLRYKADKDSFPDDLQQLITAGYLRQLPLDVYSDKPLVYKKTDGDFILYSVGENFEDDGGELGTDSKGRPRMWGDEGDVIFWPVP